jgi:hypothetical protein
LGSLRVVSGRFSEFPFVQLRVFTQQFCGKNLKFQGMSDKRGKKVYLLGNIFLPVVEGNGT